MFLAYLRRELVNRKKQSVVIALGMALAIALVIVVSGFSAGVAKAQSTALESVYGVGTDITVTQAATAGSGGPQQFDFGSGDGSTDDSSGDTSVAKSTLSAAMGTATYSASALTKVEAIDGVSAATATLSLQNSAFSGSIGKAPTSGSTAAPSSGSTAAPSASGTGDSAFSVDSFTVTGISTAATTVGPMSSTELSGGRYLKSSDDGEDVVVLDSTYATGADLDVGDTLDIGGTTFSVVGIVASTSSDSATATDTYIPLDTAQALSGLTGKISDISVAATSASDVSTVKAAIETALPKATVSTQADLASSISGSLATVSNLLSNLGTWLSLLVLAAAFAIAILFTVSGVTRRTREFGTLKAIGWSNGRIVRQVAGESMVTGLIGGAIGAAAGIIGIIVVNVIAPTLSTASTTAGGGAGAGGPGAAASSSVASDIVLQIPITAGIVLVAVGLSVLGGSLAGAFGGWRASRLRPAAALRSVA
ncbi:ABC transporter permease [Curtobacterium sp. ZW137]|uniref:ABC transporter permease n=1 Tax=Curtobacterium sp. ZW137 TaxID=2485104 RepID=UPI000F4C8B75|nr:ABC transporter permease [Curtobacterium sp. ZW137]ROP65881.1 FtsX-like permease family protein [Curtobacterium sp. ZW137]